jgi:hypothetical protein
MITRSLGERVIGKVEKGFELITNAKHMRLHLKGDTIGTNTAVDILRTLMKKSYYNGRDVKILSLTKLHGHKISSCPH